MSRPDSAALAVPAGPAARVVTDLGQCFTPVCAIIEGRNNKAAQVYHHQMPLLTTMSQEDIMATPDRTDSTIQIQLTKGYVALVDECDADLADQKWVCFLSRTGHNPIAIASRIHGDRNHHQLMHRVILERAVGRGLLRFEYTDHIDGDSLNNRRANLRIATPAQNAHNAMARKSKSGLKGAHWNSSRQKWTSCIEANGVKRHLGSFDDPELAHEAYLKAAHELFGEFVPDSARLRRDSAPVGESAEADQVR